MSEYFINGQHLGTVSIKGSDSIAYFCRQCGEIWARIVAGPEWQIQHTPCEQHERSAVVDWKTHVPGSILNGFINESLMGKWAWASAIEHLPPAVIRREFAIHLQWYEKGLQNGY